MYQVLTNTDIEKLRILKNSLAQQKKIKDDHVKKHGSIEGIRGTLSENMRRAYKEIENYGK